MTSREDLDVDDDFSEIYKAYTGPLSSNPPKAQDKATNKRSHHGSDEEEEARDPNAVPTDFTSREARVWEAKSKATERNWKKRKEEEMICKICGESGHFTQGCPSTLGANRKSQDFFERVPARDPHVKVLFSEGVINKIEKDIGCKIKIDEKFIIVSGKDRLILKKGVDAVHKIKEQSDSKGAHRFPEEGERNSSPISHSKSLRSPLTSRLGRSDTQKSNPSPHSAAHIPHRYGRQEKGVEDHVREDLQKLSSDSPRARAYGSDGGRGRPSHSKSPARPSYMENSYNSFEGHTQNTGGIRTDGWNADRGRSNMQLDLNFDYASFPQTLEELELQYKREAMELARIRDKEDDEENCKHREALREIWDSCARKVAVLRGTHANMWEDFLQLEGQKRQQSRQHISASGFGGYKHSRYAEFDNASGNLYHPGDSIHPHSRGRYSNAMDSYPSPRPQEPYDDFQRHRRDDFGKPYHRY
ncbi:hypothetical protein OROHE_006900 [Orobanche hederae]